VSDLQTMLADSASDLFSAEVTPEVLESADGGAWPAKLWKVLEEAEYPRLFTEPDVTWADAYPVVEAAGAALAPVPLPEALVASWLLRHAEIEQPPGLTTIVPQPWRAGNACSIPWGAVAQHAVAVGEAANGPLLMLLATADLGIMPGRNAANEPRGAVTARNVRPVASSPLGDLPLDIIHRLGALCRATQIAGALRRVLPLTAHYAGERTQFGRPIAQFQAVSQQLAVLAEESTAATMAAAHAWPKAATDPATTAIAVAKIRTGQAVGPSAAIAHAVFGAIGITAEHSLHFATRRMWCWRAEFGPEREWAAALGASIVAAGGSNLWPSVTSR
jgi:acyl-CoA dehydrogenase